MIIVQVDRRSGEVRIGGRGALSTAQLDDALATARLQHPSVVACSVQLPSSPLRGNDGRN